jgi:hypothetical protein
MDEPHWERATEEEVWKYVASHLARNGVDTVLVGGAVVAIYTAGSYHSGDLDLVNANDRDESIIKDSLAELGFEKSGRNFQHPRCPHLLVEFLHSPVAIGSDHQIEPREVSVEGTSIKILSPTDCAKDRLASYIYFNARECLDQAVLVAARSTVDENAVKLWCENEGERGRRAFIDFQRNLSGYRGKYK